MNIKEQLKETLQQLIDRNFTDEDFFKLSDSVEFAKLTQLVEELDETD